MHGSRLVSKVNHPQGGIEHRVEHVQDMITRNPEDSINTLRSKGTNQKITTGSLSHSC